MKKKKQNIWRKYFKTHYRAYLGYLVKYIANHIYRIWIPAIKFIIITRNMVFDKRYFYQRSTVKA
jgi:hypothetical protein